MEYIIVFRANHRGPHVLTDANDFMETFPSYEQALAFAKECQDDDDFVEFQIFQTVEK